MSKKRKNGLVKPGVCDLCGRAQVRPGEEEISSRTNGWLSGHKFEDGKLIKVRCFHHVDEEDYPRLGRRLDCFAGWI